MKKIITLTVALVSIAMFLTGCGGGTPSGSDSNVKALVMQISKDELKNQLAKMMYMKVTNIPVDLVGMEITYEGLQKKASSDEHSKKALDLVNAAMSKLNMSLENIRTDKVDKETKKSWNSADLKINNETKPIEYTAQVNDSGELYVEVFGLR
jgi:predicted small secreted protein